MFPPLGDLETARILISNDDGIDAPGIRVLEDIARSLSDDVWIVAPDRERSAASHALTIHEPLRIFHRGVRRYALSGTPTDCVLLAVSHLMDRPPDLVLSGVNRGANLGSDVHYSGTVAAAMEGTLLGLRAIALSQLFFDESPDPFDVARTHAADVIRTICEAPWARNSLVNVNFPDCLPGEVDGVCVTRLGARKIGDEIVERLDPRGHPYVWIGVQRSDEEIIPGSDFAAVMEKRISVTPIGVDMTSDAGLAALRKVFGTTQESCVPRPLGG
ncbi:5'/3'-nucleotidase SurE [Phaeovibrio sulfidiphilus]|uniref:5'-nucleotidase SurE n=1 Tax=Phaeovibrio sulfidiphilus TaxID=1220600 RepID=A0A8J6YKE7_9PROT|nr:5'/3'-nucleotidase SurE [Phaeovibrio sulfidiphilus]MBE1236160.1 5'/3'-nucleotidase SurE [Phaeovibrio sulfidiphilus]